MNKTDQYMNLLIVLWFNR